MADQYKTINDSMSSDCWLAKDLVKYPVYCKAIHVVSCKSCKYAFFCNCNDADIISNIYNDDIAKSHPVGSVTA